MQKAEGMGGIQTELTSSFPCLQSRQPVEFPGFSFLADRFIVTWHTGRQCGSQICIHGICLHSDNTYWKHGSAFSSLKPTISNEQDNFAGLETGTWTPEEGRGATWLLQADLSCWEKWEEVGLSQASLPSAEQLLPARHSTKAAKGENEDKASPQITRDVFTAMWSQRVQEELWTFGVYESHFYLLNVYTLVQEELWTFGVYESQFYLLNVYMLMNLLIIFV